MKRDIKSTHTALAWNKPLAGAEMAAGNIIVGIAMPKSRLADETKLAHTASLMDDLCFPSKGF